MMTELIINQYQLYCIRLLPVIALFALLGCVRNNLEEEELRRENEKLQEEVGITIEFPKGILRILRITPRKMVYYYNKKGISNAHWEAE